MTALTSRRKILLSTAALLGALTGYGQGANAACVGPANDVVCSGNAAANPNQLTINDNNAVVSTAAGFGVVTGDANAILMDGSGALSFTDTNSSTITGDRGLFVDGDSVTINANGNFTGTDDEGILAQASGTDLEVTIGDGGSVVGDERGLVATNTGTGTTTITANGDVTGTDRGIVATNTGAGGDMRITTGAASSIMAAPATVGANAIDVRNDGNGVLEVNVNGYAYGFNSALASEHNGTGDLNINTGAGSNMQANNTVVTTRHTGSGAINIVTNGAITGTQNDAISAQHQGGGDINITVNEGSVITSIGDGPNDFGVDAVLGTVNLIVAGELAGQTGGAARFDQIVANDDRVELRTTAVVTGNVLAGEGNDTLAFAGTGDGTFNLSNIDDGTNTRQFQDFETFVIESAIWTMNGATNADFIVDGGTLKGEGTFGSLTVNNGGTLSPGNSFGTITVNGVFTLNAGAVYEVEVNSNNMGDLVVVNGTVNLTGATLRVLADPGNYALETDHVIIQNDGTDAVVGTFATITSNLAFLIPTVLYNGGTGNDVVLRLTRNEVNPCDVAQTPNQIATCNAVDEDTPLFALILGQTIDGARQAYDALSGEIHATIAGVLVDDNRYVREAIMTRLMQAGHTDGNGRVSALGASGPQVASLNSTAMALGYDDKSLAPPPSSPMAFWTAGYGAWGKYDGDGNAATADRDLGGFMSGMDASIGGSWRVGLTTGASFSNVSVDARNSSADAETYYLGGYGGGMVGSFALRGGGTWAWSEIDTSRAVIFPGFFERQKASYDADTSQIFGEAAYPTTMGGMTVEPFVGLAYVSIDTDTFLERGGALASLRGRDTDQNVGYSTLGLRVATTSQWGSMLVVPHLSARWQHAFDDVTPEAALAFATTGTGFTVAGVPLAEDSALIDAGLDFAIGENTTAGVSYSGQFGEGVVDNAVKGRFTWLF